MIRVEISEAADADLVEILQYGTDNFGQDRAEAYVAGFQATFDLISRYPLAGAIHEGVRPPVRSLPHGRRSIDDAVAGFRLQPGEIPPSSPGAGRANGPATRRPRRSRGAAVVPPRR